MATHEPLTEVQPKRIRVLLVDDHTVVREALRALLETEDDMEVIGEAENGRRAVQLTMELHPDVVVMDIAMPLLGGIESTRQILEALPATRVLVLSAYSDEAHVEQVIGLGVAGYLTKHDSALLLAKAIRESHQGSTFLSPSMSWELRDRLQSEFRGAAQRSEQVAANLTSREAEILQLIAEGKANKQAAAELGISVKTVEKHRQNLMNRLHLHDTASLTRYAVEMGMIAPDPRPGSSAPARTS